MLPTSEDAKPLHDNMLENGTDLPAGDDLSLRPVPCPPEQETPNKRQDLWPGRQIGTKCPEQCPRGVPRTAAAWINLTRSFDQFGRKLWAALRSRCRIEQGHAGWLASYSAPAALHQ